MDNWLIYLSLLLVVSICAYTSYWSGRNEGILFGIEKSLAILMDEKVIYLDAKNEIFQYDSKIAKAARKIDRETYIRSNEDKEKQT
jgi:hypothetical protein